MSSQSPQTPQPARLHATHSPRVPVGLGLDAGGTHTRWALADASGLLTASGELPPMSGQQLASAEGRAQLVHTLGALAQAVASSPAAGPVQGLVAGITGFDARAMPQWRDLAAQALQVPPDRVRALSDIELACAAAFMPGQGVVLMAGTGSIAAHVDARGVLHRAGGRGAVIDDAGGGHWIACQALRHIWRAEDAAPGAWQVSPLARAVFVHMGGGGGANEAAGAVVDEVVDAVVDAVVDNRAHEWATTRAWVYGATRGELGSLAQAVAQAADADPAAAHILQQAGAELARLVLVLQQRLGLQPVALAGRVWDLHPLVESSLRQHLAQAGAPGVEIHRLHTPAHHAAARLAATMPA